MAMAKKRIQIRRYILFLFFEDNICCEYSLEAPMRGHCNEFIQHIFFSRNKKNVNFYAPAYSKNGGKALSVTPVRPVRTYVRTHARTYVCTRTSVPVRVRAITPKPYGIYLWNFTDACMTLRRCVVNKEDNSCLFGFFEITALDLVPYSKPCLGHNS